MWKKDEGRGTGDEGLISVKGVLEFWVLSSGFWELGSEFRRVGME